LHQRLAWTNMKQIANQIVIKFTYRSNYYLAYKLSAWLLTHPWNEMYNRR
jgi:hypothetical protein